MPAEENTKLHLSPFVYWAQTPKQIALNIDLVDPINLVIKLSQDSIYFEAERKHNENMSNKYRFQMHFYGKINDKTSSYKILINKISCTLKKATPGWWPRLLITSEKPHWLRVDFNKWSHRQQDYLSHLSLDKKEKPRNIMADYLREYEHLQKEEFGYIRENARDVYMIFYYLLQFIGFLYCLIVTGILYYRDGHLRIQWTLYVTIGSVIKVLHITKYLEVLYKASAAVTFNTLILFAEITDRIFILCVLIDIEQRILQDNLIVFVLYSIWSLIELLRSCISMSELFSKNNRIIKGKRRTQKWLHIVIWILLYPSAVLCELVIIFGSVHFFEETQRFCIEMPNPYNFTFSMPLFLNIYLIMEIIIATCILSYRIKQIRHIKQP